jgi:hypothetical protein
MLLPGMRGSSTVWCSTSEVNYKNLFTLAPSFTIWREESDLALELLAQLFRRCRR